MNPAELRDRLAALSAKELAEGMTDDEVAEAIALQRGGRHSFQAKPKAVRKKKAASKGDEA